MIKNIFILFIVFFLTLSTVYAEYSSYPEGDIDMDKVVDFYVKALKDKRYQIVLCEERRFDRKLPKADDFENYEEYIKNFEECIHEEYGLTTGENLLESTFTEQPAGWQSLYVIEAIKGAFDRIVVYHEFVKRGRIWPAFNAPSFIPPRNSQWIVVFRYEHKGDYVYFYTSGRRLPVLHLASKDFGIIRYDEPNHLNIDAKKFLSDLRTLMEYIKGKRNKISPDQLKTELGRKILAQREDLEEAKEETALLPDSKETEEVRKRIDSVKRKRMEVKAEEIEQDGPQESWLLDMITSEKDLDALLEKVRKVRKSYEAYMEKAKGTEYRFDFEDAYERFESNLIDEFTVKALLRRLQADLQSKIEMSKQSRKLIEEYRKEEKEELREIQEELKESEKELKEICTKIDKLSK